MFITHSVCVVCPFISYFPPCVCTCAIFLCVSPGCVFISPFLWHQSTNVLAWETSKKSRQSGSLIIYSSAHHRGLVFAPLTIFEVVVWYTLQLAQHTPGWLSWPLPSIISPISDTTDAPWLVSSFPALSCSSYLWIVYRDEPIETFISFLFLFLFFALSHCPIVPFSVWSVAGQVRHYGTAILKNVERVYLWSIFQTDLVMADGLNSNYFGYCIGCCAGFFIRWPFYEVD